MGFSRSGSHGMSVEKPHPLGFCAQPSATPSALEADGPNNSNFPISARPPPNPHTRKNGFPSREAVLPF
jgi:hypothetical protein